MWLICNSRGILVQLTLFSIIIDDKDFFQIKWVKFLCRKFRHLDKITNFVELHHMIPTTECDMPDETNKQVKWQSFNTVQLSAGNFSINLI